MTATHFVLMAMFVLDKLAVWQRSYESEIVRLVI